MRHLLLAALLVGTTFGQGKTPTGTEKPPIALPPIPQTAAQAKDFDPNAPQICVEVRFVSGSPEAMKQLKAGDLIRTPPAAKAPAPPSIPDEQLRANNGIQLASATRVMEERQPVFVRRLDDKAFVWIWRSICRRSPTSEQKTPGLKTRSSRFHASPHPESASARWLRMEEPSRSPVFSEPSKFAKKPRCLACSRTPPSAAGRRT